ncbi:unnamed protein product [Candida verbasci]|uniref:RRM domain-containing protein n=1 Tax=Candida verbasci TaxID=1227364 RepID=A0A9W4XKX0_9ASCO|nr:unnamed protein product [Candida verbasci]
MSDEIKEVIQEKKEVIDDGLDRKTLFIRSIPFEASSEELSEFFSQFVPVKHAVIVTDDEKKSRGFGFVSFTEDDDTLTALVESRKNKFKNRLLRVDIAKRRDRKEKSGDSANVKKEIAPIEKRRARLIIRNLPWSCKKPDELKKIFNKFGGVFDAYIPKKKGGQMCGFAFVIMKKKSAAERAIKECQGLKIDGREVAVDFAVEKSKWEQLKVEESEEESEDVSEEEEEEDNDNEEEQKNNDTEEIEEEDEENESDSDFDNLNQINSDDEPESDDVIDIEIEKQDEQDSKPVKKSNRQDPYSIFVRNIPYDADEETLKEHFEAFGPVKYALPVTDKETGLSKGSAFVSFETEKAYLECLENAPSTGDSTTMLISDDVNPEYVYQGRILSITSVVDRQSAKNLQERNSLKRKEILGKLPGEKDKRNLFLLNEGRITENSKLAQYISKTDLELREKSYKLRVQQLNKNPTLHLSLTRLAIRNLPRAMNAKALKALGRKAVVQFATEVKEGKRQQLSKEEVNRSNKFKHSNEEEKEEKEEKEENAKKSSKNKGVVKQAKVIMEVKGTREQGRSRGYGFIEFRDHKAALMALRWLNAHEVSNEEITEGLNDDEKNAAKLEHASKRRLIAEFAIENAQVVKRRKEKEMIHRQKSSDLKRKRENGEEVEEEEPSKKKIKGKKGKKGNMNKGNKKQEQKEAKKQEQKEVKKSDTPDDIKKIIAQKRRKRKGKK